MGNLLRKYLRIALLAFGVFCLCVAGYRAIGSAGGEESYDHAAEIAFQNAQKGPDVREELPEPTQTAKTEPKWIPAPVEAPDEHMQTLMEIDLKALQEVNPDVIGWILIPDSKINYPIMQGEDNDFYLGHNWERVKNPMGSVFMEHRNKPDYSQFNTILYAHNMNNGSMFADLKKFSTAHFLEKTPYVYIANASGVFRYEVFAYYKAKVDSFVYGLSFNQRETRENFIASALEASYSDVGVVPETTDRILTLSTCTGGSHESRWVVQARLPMILSE